MSDFAFLERTTDEPARRRQHVEDIRREYFKGKLKHIADDTEKAVDYCRDLIRAGSDVKDELAELETTARGLLLVALLLKRECANG